MLPLGFKQRLALACAVMHHPQVLFLDEPTIGLDIVAQTTIRKFLGDYVRDKGPTVILTSHYMDDIAKLADRLLLISKGSIVYDGTVPEFVAKSDRVRKLSFSLAEPLPEDLELAAEMKMEKGAQEFSFEVKEEALAKVLGKVTGLSGIQNLQFQEANFEDIIHRFLEKESRILQTRGSATT